MEGYNKHPKQSYPQEAMEVVDTSPEERKDKHLHILDQIHRLDGIVGDLDYLIQRLHPSDTKSQELNDAGYDHISLHDFLTKTPEVIGGKISSILKRLEVIKQLIF